MRHEPRFFHLFVDKTLERVRDREDWLKTAVDRRRHLANKLAKRSGEISEDRRYSDEGRDAALAVAVADARQQLAQLRVETLADRAKWAERRAIAASGRTSLHPNGVSVDIADPPPPNDAASELRAIEIRRRFEALKPLERQQMYWEAAKAGRVEVTRALEGDPFGAMVNDKTRATVEQLRVETSPWGPALADWDAQLNAVTEIDGALERFFERGA